MPTLDPSSGGCGHGHEPQLAEAGAKRDAEKLAAQRLLDRLDKEAAT